MPIRLAIPADIPLLLNLASHAPNAAQWSLQQYEDAISQSEPRRLVLVLEEQGVMGFLVARAVDLEWELENIAVEESARRRGYGGQLVSELLQRASQRGAEEIFLEVRESNHSARALYEKCGFAQAGRRSNYYANPAEDAILYRCSLP